MELSSVRWLSDLGMDDPTFLHPCEMSSLDQLTSQHIATAFGDDFQSSFSSESYTSYPTFTPHRSSTAANTFSGSSMEASQTGGGSERPAKLLKTGSWGSHNTDQVSPTAAAPDASSPSILSFGGNQEAASGPQHFLRGLVGAPVRPKEEMGFSITQATKRAYESVAADQGAKRVHGGSRPPSHAQDHIIAERKRREKLSQRFIALSAIVPGLKKMDKASVLGDAIKYVKQLQERVMSLEEQATKRTVESAVLVKKSQLPVDDDTSSSDENFDGSPNGRPMPEIEAKLSEKSVLVRIHCEKRPGVLVKVLAEIEKLHLTVVNTSSMHFAGSSLDITVMAQMDEEFSMTVKDLVKHLHAAFRQFM